MTVNTPYTAIRCELYDYLELACVYNYDIEASLTDGTIIEGRAQTLEIADGAEYLLIVDANSKHHIRLDRLRMLTVKSPDRTFDSVSFTP